jgi:nicotinamide riboside transporter PnuC
MIYMLKINILVMTVVFGFAAVFILGLFAWSEAMKYARALRAMQRIAAPAHRERLAISRMTSRNSHRDSIRVA